METGAGNSALDLTLNWGEGESQERVPTSSSVLLPNHHLAVPGSRGAGDQRA